MKPWQERVVQEQYMLANKIATLTKALADPDSPAQADKDLLTQQLTAMQTYNDVLLARIAAFTQKLPRYRCHKVVGAFKIASVKNDPDNVERIILVPTQVVGYPEIQEESVDEEWMHRTRCAVGWYFVRYKDGYTSASPADEFEDGYTLIPQ